MELLKKAKLILETGKEYWRYYENTYLLTPDSSRSIEDEAQGQEGSFSRKLSSKEKAKLTTRRYRRLKL
jgi:hypothetical protein